MNGRLTVKEVENKVAYLRELTGLDVEFINIKGYYGVSGAARAFEFGSPNLREVCTYLDGAIDLAQLIR